MEKGINCPPPAISHGSKVFIAGFVLANILMPRKFGKDCSNAAPSDEVPNEKGFMDHSWKLAPYNYKLSKDPPNSSMELLMMRSLREYEKRNPPKDPKEDMVYPIHYDYGTVFKSIKL